MAGIKKNAHENANAHKNKYKSETNVTMTTAVQARMRTEIAIK